MKATFGRTEPLVAPWRNTLLQLSLKDAREELRAARGGWMKRRGHWGPRPCPLKVFEQRNVVGYFAPMREWDEASTMPPLPGGLQIAYPRLDDENLVFHVCTLRELVPHPKWPILEAPANAPICKPDVLFIPALIADEAGNRIGRGAGFYDRYLAAHPDVYGVGVLHSDYLYPRLPANWLHAGDRKLKALLTEKQFILAKED